MQFTKVSICSKYAGFWRGTGFDKDFGNESKELHSEPAPISEQFRDSLGKSLEIQTRSWTSWEHCTLPDSSRRIKQTIGHGVTV